MRGRIAQAPMSQPASPTRLNRNATLAAAAVPAAPDTLGAAAALPPRRPGAAGCGPPHRRARTPPVDRAAERRPAAGLASGRPRRVTPPPPQPTLRPGAVRPVAVRPLL